VQVEGEFALIQGVGKVCGDLGWVMMSLRLLVSQPSPLGLGQY
jgi:hypothetical protein